MSTLCFNYLLTKYKRSKTDVKQIQNELKQVMKQKQEKKMIKVKKRNRSKLLIDKPLKEKSERQAND